jgi:hypothetical protein
LEVVGEEPKISQKTINFLYERDVIHRTKRVFQTHVLVLIPAKVKVNDKAPADDYRLQKLQALFSPERKINEQPMTLKLGRIDKDVKEDDSKPTYWALMRKELACQNQDKIKEKNFLEAVKAINNENEVNYRLPTAEEVITVGMALRARTGADAFLEDRNVNGDIGLLSQPIYTAIRNREKYFDGEPLLCAGEFRDGALNMSCAWPYLRGERIGVALTMAAGEEKPTFCC